MRDSLSRTLNTTDIIQVITRLDVASESSGVGSCDISEGSDSPGPPLVSGPGFTDTVTDNDFISRWIIGVEVE